MSQAIDDLLYVFTSWWLGAGLLVLAVVFFAVGALVPESNYRGAPVWLFATAFAVLGSTVSLAAIARRFLRGARQE